MAGPIIGALRKRFRDNHPLAAVVADGVRAAAARKDTGTTPADVPKVEEEIVGAITSDPVAANALGLERGTESRTGMSAVGSILTGTGTLLASIGAILSQASVLSGFARAAFIGTALLGTGTLGSGLYGAFGRFREGLPPMYFRWWNPLSYLARRKADVMAEPAR